MEYLVTPFGKVRIFIDDIDVLYSATKMHPNERCCPDIAGRYHISVQCTPDGKEHEIKCIIENMMYSDKWTESGEMLECQSFFSADNWKLSIGVECEGSDRYDYDARYLENGMSYVILPETKEDQFTFGIAWIRNAKDDCARSVQTWYAADPTLD